MVTSKGFTTLAAAATGLLGLAGMAQNASAAVIYSDNFVQPNGTQLNGQTVQTSNGIAGGTSGAQWTACTTQTDGPATTTGSGAYIPGHEAIFLPFAAQAGYVYTLTATLDPTSTDWVSLGFADGSYTGGNGNNIWQSTGTGNTDNNPVSWALDRAGTNGGQPQFFGGPGTNADIAFGASTDSGLQTFVITLNTTGTEWTSSAYVTGDPSLTASYTYTSGNPTITTVGFGTDNTQGIVSAFSLDVASVAVPEPATLSMLAIVGLGLLLGKRRKTA